MATEAVVTNDHAATLHSRMDVGLAEVPRTTVERDTL
jgi:hypothetical protein